MKSGTLCVQEDWNQIDGMTGRLRQDFAELAVLTVMVSLLRMIRLGIMMRPLMMTGRQVQCRKGIGGDRQNCQQCSQMD